MKRNISRLINASLCLYLALNGVVPVQASHASSQPTQHGEDEYKIYLPLVMNNAPLAPIIPDTTKVLPASTTDHLTSVSNDGAEFTFDQSTSALAALTSGDIMVGDVSPNAPDGFLRKITTLQAIGGQIVVDTVPVSLDDAIQQGEAHISQALSPDQIQSAEYAPGVSLARHSPTAQAATFYLEVNNLVLYDVDGDTSTKDDQVLGNGKIEVQPSINFDLLIRNWRLEQLRFTQSMDDKVEIKVEAKATLGQVKHELELARYTLAPVTVMVGLMPVVLVPVLTFVIGIDGSVYLAVSMKATQEATLTGGLQYVNGNWGPVSEFSNNFHWEQPQLSAGLELKGYAGPRIEILVYGVAGPQIKLDGYVKLEADSAETPWWKLYGGLEVSASARMEMLGHEIANQDYPDVIGIKWRLAQAGGPGSPISAGWFHTCALTPAGAVKCWGQNDYGQLGDGTTTSSLVPVTVAGFVDKVVAVSSGSRHTCALTEKGGVKCWGMNTTGELGNGTTVPSLVPVDVSGLTSGVSAISAGGFYTCALMTQTGGVKCWGENSFGNLGNNTFTESNVPVDVWELESGVIAISAGYAHACAVTVAGGAKCWGYNGNGGLGNGSSDYMSQVPVDVAGLAAGVSFISAGTDHTCAVTQAGAVKCWGDNTYGELGDGTTTGSLVPVDVPDLASGVSALSAGTDHTCALTQAGGIKCWGADEADDMSHIPVDVNGLADGVSALTVGHYHACVLLQSGGGKCWGSNSYGQLGDGTTNLRMIPVDVVWFP